MAALLVVATIMTGCSSDDDIDNQQQTEINNNVVTLTATISFDSNAGTRAVTPSTGAKTFESTNQIAVIYKDGDSKTQKAVSTTFTPSADGTKATFTVTLNNPANNSAIRYIYPATMAKDVATDATITSDDATIDYTGLLNSQNGDLTTLGTNYDLAVYDGSLNGTDLPSSSTLTNPLAICGFTLTDGGSDITNTVNSLTVSDGTNSYAITPSALSTIYVAMKPTSGNIAFAASTTATKTYFKTATGKTLDASKLYPISVSMVELALGNVFCSDGSVFESKLDATSAGKTPVATICYLGKYAETSPTNTAYKHGLALALKDANTDARWSINKSEFCLPAHYVDEFDAKNDMAGIANTDVLLGHTEHEHSAASSARNYKYDASVAAGTHPTGTSAWFLPSVGQMDMMIDAAGTPANLKSAAQLSLAKYWFSTESSDETAWLYGFGITSTGWNKKGKDEYHYARACLAF
jgi:hypothetical protein